MRSAIDNGLLTVALVAACPALTLEAARFPFSGRNWDTMQVLTIGLITVGGGYTGLGLGRFVHLEKVGRGIVDRIPLIAA